MASYDNLQLSKYYWFNASFTDPGTKQVLKARDTNFQASSYQLPTRQDLILQ